MAITPSDFYKIWASNADTPEYTFTEADYLKGWDFVGNLPPTRAQWNAMQKSTDEKMKYVFDNFGAPLIASTVAEMTMQNRVYVYTGSETGYTAGHWYYWNGSAWTDGGVYNSNTVQVDPTLTISGAAADAMAVGDGFYNIDYQFNREHNYINYNYSTGEERLEIVPSTTDSRTFGIKRIGTLVEITGGGIATPTYIKLTNSLARTITGETVQGWSNGISLNAGRYCIEMVPLNGDALAHLSNVSVSVYKPGTSSTTGQAIRENGRFVREFDASDDTPLNLAFYINGGTAVFNNAKFNVSLYKVGQGSILDEYLDDKINEENNLINYGYPVAEDFLLRNPSATDGAAFGVHRVGTHCTFTGGGIAWGAVLRVTNVLTRTTVTATINSWNTGITLKEGRRYKITFRALNDLAKSLFEEYARMGVSVYRLGTSSTIGTWERDLTNHIGIRTFEAPADMINMALYVPAHVDFGDVGADFDITLKDVTFEDESDAIAPYYIDELNDTINKINNLKDEPCLTFMWATDIHRLSSNALGVQTFSKMIQNMKAFSNSVKCDFILNTGDDTDGDVAKATTLTRAYDMTKEFMSVGIPYIKSNGNHDNNPYNGELNYFNITDVYKAYYTLTPRNATINVAENGTDFYIDYNDIGVRFISVNDNNIKTSNKYSWGTTTPNWLTSALDTDKTVLLSLHISLIPTQVYGNQSVSTSARNNAVLNALNNFVNNGGNLIMLSGHSHADMAFISPFLSVMEVCQRYYEDAGSVDDSEGFQAVSGYIDVIKRPVREAGTYTEDAWTAGVYKPFSNELHLIRFGAGTDRHFHITPIAPTTVTTMLTGTITWSSSDETVATVADGVITGIGTGKCAVLAKDEVGNYECWIVSVE